ncbi:MAG: ABC transporter permease [Armatimonadota bacterium]|nr:ABC transporter permease [Armatimonadota bacterium]MDR5701995.1 ABC transporter permease [Armatimonadota bacterium]
MWKVWIVLRPALSLLLAFTVGAAFLAIAGLNPIKAYVVMLEGPFGSWWGVTETVVKATPLILTSLAVLLPAKMQLWNIGAEGQLHLGAIGATWVALFFPFRQEPQWVIPLMITAGFVAGALWAGIPGVLRAYLNVNEVITTLMLNYVAVLWVDYLIYGPWKDPVSLGFPLTPLFPGSARFPTIPGTRIHLGLLLGLVGVFLVSLILGRTRWGFEIRVIGDNPSAARYAGMNLAKNILLTMMVAGGLAGLAGVGEVAAIQGRLQRGISPGYGYTAILVAWLARLNPWATVLVSFLLGGLLLGGDSLQIAMGVPVSVVYLLQGLIFFFVLGGDALMRSNGVAK